MPLSVIGSGFGRTGTLSLKFALEQLGFGPCHHMTEVFPSPAQVGFWCDIAARRPVDWDQMFAGFGATLDWPSCNYWRELAEAFPAAKVIHTTRPAEQWWGSFAKTIAESLTIRAPTSNPVQARMREMTSAIITEDVFGGRPDDKAVALAAFHAREAAVRAAIAPERLLVLEPGDGWEKLCRFLGVAVPATAYPRTNTTEDFRAKSKGKV